MGYGTASIVRAAACDARASALAQHRRTRLSRINTLVAAATLALAAALAVAWLGSAFINAASMLRASAPVALETVALARPHARLLSEANVSAERLGLIELGYAEYLTFDAQPGDDIASAPAPAKFTLASVEPEAQIVTASLAPIMPPLVKRPRAVDILKEPVALPEIGSHTAIYDIAAHVVYLPNGEKLEAHSGVGRKLDDPRFVSVRMEGPTPPHLYELKLREEPFHGVRALRLNPVGDGNMFGRDGILAHSYMLGSNGQSNGCVSFANYPAFLHAFMSGEIDHLVVVPHLDGDPKRFARSHREDLGQYAF
jgi:hypothetical protein